MKVDISDTSSLNSLLKKFEETLQKHAPLLEESLCEPITTDTITLLLTKWESKVKN